MFAKVISYNMQFKSAKPVKPVYGLTHCYVDARTGALGGKNEKDFYKFTLCFLSDYDFCCTIWLKNGDVN